MTMRSTVRAGLTLLLIVAPVPALSRARQPAPPLLVPQATPPPQIVLQLVLPPAPEFVPFIDIGPPRLAASVRAMIEEAIRSDDAVTVAAVVKIALKTQPYDEQEIREMQRVYNDRKAKALADRTAAERERIRRAHLLDLWKGQIELGAFRATGNTNNFGFTGAFKLNRKGLDWEHSIQVNADYQEDAGTVTREQFGAAYQPRYTLNDRLFTYGRLQYERDRIQGFNDRYSLSGGLGYRLIERKKLTLSLEAGPALRRTNFVTAPNETALSALTSLDLDWNINPTIKLSEDASSYIEPGNSTFTSATAIEAGMAKGLKAKFSYSIEHETSPPAGTLNTDTISRFSLVYGF